MMDIAVVEVDVHPCTLKRPFGVEIPEWYSNIIGTVLPVGFISSVRWTNS